jgi:hypothetical protein
VELFNSKFLAETPFNVTLLSSGSITRTSLPFIVTTKLIAAPVVEFNTTGLTQDPVIVNVGQVVVLPLFVAVPELPATPVL